MLVIVGERLLDDLYSLAALLPLLTRPLPLHDRRSHNVSSRCQVSRGRTSGKLCILTHDTDRAVHRIFPLVLSAQPTRRCTRGTLLHLRIRYRLS
jgi:hypothetical protein